MELTQSLIEEEQQRSSRANTTKAIKDKALKTVLGAVRELHLCINPLAMSGDDILGIIEQITSDLRGVLDKIKNENIENVVEENVRGLLLFGEILVLF
jgi:hypothetical protein